MAEDKPEKKPRRRIKKVKGHGGHHGGAWKVAYADFVTAMMALFLVLWLVSQSDEKLKQEIASYFRSPGIFEATGGGVLPNSATMSKEADNITLENEDEVFISIQEVVRKKISARNGGKEMNERVKIEVTNEGLKIQLLDKAEKVSFPSGSSDLTDEAREILADIANSICTLPNPLFIGGHTDKHVFSTNSAYSNWELSADRANAARRALEAGCVKPEQIRRIVGYADSEPLYPNSPYSPANRRISMTVLRLANQSEPIKFEPSAEPEKTLKNNRSLPVSINKVSNKTVDASEKATGEKTVKLSEKETAKAKLDAEGAVKVGEDDVIAPNVRKTIETPTPRPE